MFILPFITNKKLDIYLFQLLFVTLLVSLFDMNVFMILKQSGNEWKVKHDVLHGRLEEVAGIQAKYQALENQYAALALLVKGTDTSAVLKVSNILIYCVTVLYQFW